MVVGEKFQLKHYFDGMPKPEDFTLVKEELPDLKDGEILVSALFLSVDPYMRPYTRRIPLSAYPITMIGQSVQKVIESKDKEFPKGCNIMCNIGWVKTGIINPKQLNAKQPMTCMKAPELPGVSPSLLLGACGMPGNTAYFGFLEICQPKAGETVVVNGAAGAVGSLVGQIAKIKGCHVIGFAGTDDKCQTLLKKYGFDKAYNYKKISAEDALKDGAPNGVDCFFDNVGGEDAVTVIKHMNKYGRISLCGAISTYNDGEPPKLTATNGVFIGNELKMEGFMVTRWASRWLEGIQQMGAWIKDGKIKVDETIVDGFQKLPDAFIGLFQSGTSNLGKIVVKS